MSAPQPQYPAPTLAEAELALFYLDSDCARDRWVQMGMALKAEFGQDGFDVWSRWSQQAPGYKAVDARDTWRSIKGAGGITIATLFAAAVEAGWRHQREETLDQKQARELAAAERAKANRVRQEQEERDRVTLQNKVAEVCLRIRDQCLSRDGSAPYLSLKGVEAFGVGFVKTPFIIVNHLEENTVELLIGASFVRDFFNSNPAKNESISFKYVKPGTLVVPLKDEEGRLWNFQLIFQSGRKSFLKGGRKQGLFHVIPGAERWGVVEGYATGASCHMATGWTIAVAFDAGNLGPVCRAMHALFPDMPGAVLGDDDISNKENTGRLKAEAVASELGIPAVFPTFKTESEAA